MKNALKLIIPLLDESFTLDDISEKAGFIDAYLEDMNRPYLTNHTFLLYDAKLDTIEKYNRDVKFRNSKALHKRINITINGVVYTLYIFVNTNKEIRTIRSGLVPSFSDNFMRIQLFWQLTDGFINSLIVVRNRPFETEGICVPEEDYVPSLYEDVVGTKLAIEDMVD